MQITRQSVRNIQLQMKCRDILTYSNVVGIFWTHLTWNMNNCAWPPKNKNTTRICWKILLSIMIVQRHHFQNRNIEKESIQPWQKRTMKNKTPNVTPITWLRKLSFSPPSRPIHQERKQILQMRGKFIWTVWHKH